MDAKVNKNDCFDIQHGKSAQSLKILF